MNVGGSLLSSVLKILVTAATLGSSTPNLTIDGLKIELTAVTGVSTTPTGTSSSSTSSGSSTSGS